MAPARNASVKFIAAVQEGYPVAGQHVIYSDSDEIDLDSIDLQGGVLLHNRVVSIDPYQRGRMRSAETKSYVAAFELNKPITNFGVGRIIRSDHSKFAVGNEIFCAAIGFAEYSVISENQLEGPTTRIIDHTLNLPLEKWTGAAGMPGMTAFHGFYVIGEPKKGETIFISAASGAVGQVVGQLAKREGLQVIGSCGSDDKVEFLKKELQFDHAFNYKTSNTLEQLKKFNPIDIYWDNVGGETLDQVFLAANTKARFIACGMISQYNASGQPYGVKNLMYIVAKSIKIQGFIVSNQDIWEPTAPKFYSTVPKWLSTGEIKSKEDITKGLDKAVESLIGIFKGKNFGKAVVEIWDGQ